MRKIFSNSTCDAQTKITKRKTLLLSTMAMTFAGSALLTVNAQDLNGQSGSPIVYPSQSSIYNQNGVNLPNAPMVHGQDEVHGAGGVSCRSAIANAGPMVDMGVISSDDVYDRGGQAMYGRVVVPLGKRAKRIDCNRLYELELMRMQMELEMMRSGLAMDRVSEVTGQPRHGNAQVQHMAQKMAEGQFTTPEQNVDLVQMAAVEAPKAKAQVIERPQPVARKIDNLVVAERPALQLASVPAPALKPTTLQIANVQPSAKLRGTNGRHANSHKTNASLMMADKVQSTHIRVSSVK